MLTRTRPVWSRLAVKRYKNKNFKPTRRDVLSTTLSADSAVDSELDACGFAACTHIEARERRSTPHGGWRGSELEDGGIETLRLTWYGKPGLVRTRPFQACPCEPLSHNIEVLSSSCFVAVPAASQYTTWLCVEVAYLWICQRWRGRWLGRRASWESTGPPGSWLGWNRSWRQFPRENWKTIDH